MDVLKVVAVAALALGSTWVARAATDALFDAPAVRPLMQAPAAAPAEPAPAEPAAGAPTREDIEAELRRARAELGEGDAAEVREFRPSKPLAADLPIALPSDI
jgi:hypothetical protein